MKKKYAFSLLILVCFFSKNANAQASITPKNTFSVLVKANTPDADLASKCIEKSDFNNYRLRNTRRKLTFDNGVIIELLSAIELKNMGQNINTDFYAENLPKNYIEPIYSITANGDLIQNHTPSAKFKGQ